MNIPHWTYLVIGNTKTGGVLPLHRLSGVSEIYHLGIGDFVISGVPETHCKTYKLECNIVRDKVKRFEGDDLERGTPLLLIPVCGKNDHCGRFTLKIDHSQRYLVTNVSLKIEVTLTPVGVLEPDKNLEEINFEVVLHIYRSFPDV